MPGATTRLPGWVTIVGATAAGAPAAATASVADWLVTLPVPLLTRTL